MAGTPAPNAYPENPVVVRVRRGGRVESVHRGAWCLVDPAGEVLAGAGDFRHAYFARSSVKALQALPLFESGAAEHFQFSEEEVALAIASHAGETCHTEIARRTLERLGLGVRHLQCGPHPPMDGRTREELAERRESPSALHNNCSGKHVGFLALAKELGVPPAAYLDPASPGQVLVREAIAALAGVEPATLVPAIDGCSAPTYRLSLAALATAFARVTNPEALPRARRAHLERMTRAAAAHPVLIAGSSKWLDTDLLRATHGRLFAKIGAEAVHAIGVVGGGRGLAVKIDDGGGRALHALVLGLIERFELASAAELAGLDAWREHVLRNFAGLEVGSIEALIAGPGSAGPEPS